VNEKSQLSESVKVRLYLLEGLGDKSSRDYWSSQLPPEFLERHEKEIVPNVGSKLEGRDDSFFAKWLRYERQDVNHWYIENRINDAAKRLATRQAVAKEQEINAAAKRRALATSQVVPKEQEIPDGYNLDTATDPPNLRLDHERYMRWPRSIDHMIL
jgi:hypothetical protein